MKYDWRKYEKRSSEKKVPFMERLIRNKQNFYDSFKRIWKQKTLELKDESILLQIILITDLWNGK